MVRASLDISETMRIVSFQACTGPLSRSNPWLRPVCALDGDMPRTVRFRKESAEAPRTSFRQTEKPNRIQTPNERLLEDVRNAMEELGVTAVDSTSPPPIKKLSDYSHVRPLPAFAGAAGAAVISVILWQILESLIGLYLSHPPHFDLYIVQRITGVIRTAVIGLLSLASGISGVTAIGLLLLGGKVTVESFQKSVKSDE